MGDPVSQDSAFRVSSYSVSQGACVEVGHGFSAAVVIRDSKDIDGTAIPVGPKDWRQFISRVKLESGN
jgi:hypothetical protein